MKTIKITNDPIGEMERGRKEHHQGALITFMLARLSEASTTSDGWIPLIEGKPIKRPGEAEPRVYPTQARALRAAQLEIDRQILNWLRKLSPETKPEPNPRKRSKKVKP